MAQKEVFVSPAAAIRVFLLPIAGKHIVSQYLSNIVGIFKKSWIFIADSQFLSSVQRALQAPRNSNP